MQQPNPALIAQSAVRRLPRLWLLLLCLAYALPGFIARDPWRSSDITAFGYMWELARGATDWLHPQLLGDGPAPGALLPYWLGAWAIQACAGWLEPAQAARLPFLMLLGLALTATWYAVYNLARTPQAQPVLFAFGGEASPADYACAMADGGLLALLASLGLVMLAHETSPALAQLAFAALSFCAATRMLRSKPWASPLLLLGLCGLALSGAPTLAVLLGLGSMVLVGRYDFLPSALERDAQAEVGQVADARRLALQIALCTAAAALLATLLDQWQWRIQPVPTELRDFRGMGRLLLWFGWPASPLAAWTFWRWRKRWRSPHLALPLWFVAVALATTLSTASADRSLLLGLPALATLAAFALPTLSRMVTAMIDWFTLLFFSAWAAIVWLYWLAMQTGFPAKPADSIRRLAPGFEPHFSMGAVLVALLATLAWIAVVRWRVGRHRAAIWKSLVLPAGGTTLGWLLGMTLMLGPLDYALSNAPLVARVQAIASAKSGCAEVRGLSEGLVTALRYHGGYTLETVDAGCPWLFAVDESERLRPGVDTLRWEAVGAPAIGPRGGEAVQVYRRATPPASAP